MPGQTAATTRKRGAVLEHAIHTATLEELADAGYAAFVVDRVARRARVGRASLYRRWSGKHELIAAAVASSLPPLDDPPDTGSLRGDLVACFERMHGLLDGPGTLAFQALAAELHDPGHSALIVLLREQVLEPRLQRVLDVLLRGAARGEIRAEAAVPVLARTGPALLIQHLLMFGTPAPHHQIVDIVDRVILPAARGSRD